MSTQLNASSIFDFGQVSFDKESEVHLDVILTAPEKTKSKRIPLHLILAIDCSGSMDGGKLDAVKKTTEKLITHLTENDTLGMIGFSDTVWDIFKALPMTKENKEQAKKEVKKLRTISATNLSGAMIMAMERAIISDDSKVSRIVLLTDGLPSSGECDKQKLTELAHKMNQRISMSTFGYGLDFDAELMASISSAGRGSSFYIKEDEDCNKAFAMELGGLLSLYAQNIKLVVTPSNTMEFKELLSEYKCEQKQGYRLITGQKIEIQIDDIFAGEKKHVILKLAVPQATEAVCARDTRVCAVAISYTDIETKAFNSITFNSFIQYVKPDKAPKTPNEDVQKQILLLEAAKFQKEAQDKADQGQYDEAQKILSNGLNFVHLNERLMENAPAVANMFTNLKTNFSDAHTYRSKGTKLATSYRYSMSNNRGASADTLSYASSGQADMLAQFMKDPDSEKEDEK
jgi:Ca-activated chloride channel family protein